MIFLRIRRGKLSNLWGQWGKSKRELINSFSCHLPLLSYSPFIHCLIQQPFCLIPVSTTKLNPLMLVGEVIAWIVVWQDCQSFPTCTLRQGPHSPSRGQEETMTPILHFSSRRELGELSHFHDFCCV